EPQAHLAAGGAPQPGGDAERRRHLAAEDVGRPRAPVDGVLEHPRHPVVVLGGGDQEALGFPELRPPALHVGRVPAVVLHVAAIERELEELGRQLLHLAAGSDGAVDRVAEQPPVQRALAEAAGEGEDAGRGRGHVGGSYRSGARPPGRKRTKRTSRAPKTMGRRWAPTWAGRARTGGAPGIRSITGARSGGPKKLPSPPIITMDRMNIDSSIPKVRGLMYERWAAIRLPAAAAMAQPTAK